LIGALLNFCFEIRCTLKLKVVLSEQSFVATFMISINLKRKVDIDTKIKAIKKKKHNVSMREKVVTKFVIKWLYKYHFSN